MKPSVVIFLTAMFYMTSIIDPASGRSMNLKPLAMRGSRDLAIRKDPYAIAKCTLECETDSDCVRVEISEDGSCTKKQHMNSVAGGSSGETLSIEGYTPSCSNVLHSDLYTIPLPGSNDPDFISIYCQVHAVATWTVIQGRVDGTVDFNRNWADYKSGFGYIQGNFWLGNEALHKLTADGQQTLSLEMQYPDGEWAKQAWYSGFMVAGEEDKYRLSYGTFIGGHPPGDGFNFGGQVINGMQFSTPDSDNDAGGGSCAANMESGWWYRGCHSCNPNGLYGSNSAKGITWYPWKYNFVSMIQFRMMIASSDSFK